MGLVIAMFILTAVYVRYHVMQQPVEEAEEHDIELKILNKDTRIISITKNTILFKTII